MFFTLLKRVWRHELLKPRSAKQNNGDAFRLDVLKLSIFEFGKGGCAPDDEYLKTPVNFAKKLPPKFYEKIQAYGNQTLKRPIFVELKKGGSCSASFIPATFINTGNPSLFF